MNSDRLRWYVQSGDFLVRIHGQHQVDVKFGSLLTCEYSAAKKGFLHWELSPWVQVQNFVMSTFTARATFLLKNTQS